ncbi:DUF4099 domain-containing protein [Pedobacter miscanthi]|uniref:DUF4099 domain-containing protein n=1 Tax=Pedobacter miscanthi TaxID=2259170 RepID=UPI002930629C|nr:DUF4099 domain-containing protein [Pedobacter miscanthi]
MKNLFDQSELPLKELENLGVYHKDQLLLDPHNIRALLAGRRTELLSLEGLRAENFSIDRLDAKLSLARSPGGEVQVLIHPIYKQYRPHPLLTEEQMSSLIDGKSTYIGKSIQMEEGKYSMLNIEYDKETKEFISYEVSSVQVPDLINGMFLSQEEKSAYQRGEQIELADGTLVQHRASEPLGILSDRKALIFSVLLDGGISYLLLRGIKSLMDNARQANYSTPSFNSAYEQMEGQKYSAHKMVEIGQNPAISNPLRGLSR